MYFYATIFFLYNLIELLQHLITSNKKNFIFMAKERIVHFRRMLTFAVVLGGSSDSRERTSLSSAELLSFLPQQNLLNNFHRTLLPDLCIPRRSPAIFKFPCDHLFVIGGCSGPRKHLCSAELLHIKNRENKWKLVENNIENNIHPFSCAAFCQLNNDGDGFVFGGYDGLNCLCQVLKIDKNEPHRVEQLKPIPFGLKNSVALPSNDSQKIWLVGGWDGRRTLTTILEYDLATQNCEIRRLLPYPLEGHSIAKSKTTNFAFICGGFDGTGIRQTILVMDQNTVEIIGMAEETLTIGRENSVAFCIFDGLEEWMAVVGGWNGQNALNDFELFKVLPEHPFLRKEKEINFELQFARNRPAAVTFNSF